MVHDVLFLTLFYISSVQFWAISCEKVLATVPSLNVVLNDVLFMEVVRPVSIGYTYKIRMAKNFGTNFAQKYNNIPLVIGEPYNGCTGLLNKQSVENNLVMLQRGDCSFTTKSLKAQEAGALGVIITDNNVENDSLFVDMVADDTNRPVAIPAVYLLGKDGHMIQRTLSNLGSPYALINIPLNITGATIHQISQPPWTLW